VRFLTIPLGTLLSVGLINFASNAVAQCALPPDSGAIKSSGIQGSIVSVIDQPRDNKLAITIALQNLTNQTAHILTVGNLQLATSSGAAMNETCCAANINVCVHSTFDAENMGECMTRDVDSLNEFTDIDPCGKILGTIYFQYGGPKDSPAGKTINYTFRAIARFSEANSDPSVADKPPSPPHKVTLNFPPLQVH
jgi:hypothetical protein